MTQHINSSHSHDLLVDSPNYLTACDMVNFMKKSICKSCRRVYKLITQKGLCRACDALEGPEEKLEKNLDPFERANLTNGASEALTTRLKIVNYIPRKLYTLWSKALTKALLALAKAKTEREGREATERYFKLKGTLVMPLRAGSRHRGHAVRSMEKRLWTWIEGKHDEVWEAAVNLENKRSKKKSNNIKEQDKTGDDPWSVRDLERRYRRAKTLANDGEYSKAFSAIVDRGKAPISAKVMKDLKRMNPPRMNTVCWPTKKEVEEERQRARKVFKKWEVGATAGEQTDISDFFEDGTEAAEISTDDIIQAAKTAKRNSSGGLQQITLGF